MPSCLPGDEDRLILECGFPLIVKPRVGARSIGFRVIKNMDELQRAIKQQPGIVIQKYVGSDSMEFTAGTLTFDGKCTATIVMKRDLRDGNTYRAFVVEHSSLNAVVQAAANCLKAYGPANFQFRLDDGIPRIFEINGRFSGTTPLRARAGFNEVEMSIRHILYGEPVTQPRIEPLVFLRHWSETVVKPVDILSPKFQTALMKNKGHLVVTGASGFIGTRLVEVAIKAGWEVTALLRDTAQLSDLNCVLLRTERWHTGQDLLSRGLLSGWMLYAIWHHSYHQTMVTQFMPQNAFGLMRSGHLNFLNRH